MPNVDYQHKPGQLGPCCAGMRNALSCGYIQRGYLWYKYDPPMWIPWTIKFKGEGWYDLSPIAFCPFCGRDLDSSDN